MADERTMSTFTLLNTSLRNRQKVSTLVDMIQIRQHNRRIYAVSIMTMHIIQSSLTFCPEKESEEDPTSTCASLGTTARCSVETDARGL